MTNGCINELSFAVTPAFSDNCSTNLTVSIVSTVTNGTACAATVVRTWRADDGCGNTTDVSQTNYVFDTTAPVAVSVPGPLTKNRIELVWISVTPGFREHCSTVPNKSNPSTATN